VDSIHHAQITRKFSAAIFCCHIKTLYLPTPIILPSLSLILMTTSAELIIDLYPEFGWSINGEAVYAPGSIFEGK
jgi:hypothetical protein